MDLSSFVDRSQVALIVDFAVKLFIIGLRAEREGFMLKKSLAEMTLEELWQLFPIELVEHQSAWAGQYAEMESVLFSILRSYKIVRTSHIGSTSVEGMWAKPIIDILVEIAPGENISAVSDQLEKNGFIKMNGNDRRISLNVGYTENGFADKVYHIHLRYSGDNDELYFRDYLRDHPDIAKEYEELKLKLAQKFKHDRDAYTEAKSDFINRITKTAKALYGDHLYR